MAVYSHLQACGMINDHDAECPCFYQINERYPIFQLKPDDEARLMTLRNMPEQ